MKIKIIGHYISDEFYYSNKETKNYSLQNKNKD